MGARPRPGSSRSGRLLALVVASALLGGCALGGSDASPGSDDRDSLPRDLAAEPERLLPAEVPTPVFPTGEPPEEDPGPEEAGATGSGSGGGGGGGNDEKDQVDAAGVFPPPPPGGQGSTTTRLVQVEDAAGDSGHDTAYADGVRLTVMETDDRAVITVDVAGDVPNPLPTNEVMGVGVDLFTGTSRESDHQVFADGSDEGWFAYLHTPRGIVEFPGQFRLGGQRMVFEIPWSALGNPRTGRVSAFADWSRGGEAARNPFSEDFVPDSGTRTFSR